MWCHTNQPKEWGVSIWIYYRFHLTKEQSWVTFAHTGRSVKWTYITQGDTGLWRNCPIRGVCYIILSFHHRFFKPLKRLLSNPWKDFCQTLEKTFVKPWKDLFRTLIILFSNVWKYFCQTFENTLAKRLKTLLPNVRQYYCQTLDNTIAKRLEIPWQNIGQYLVHSKWNI